jgi:hypothetical protein
MHLPQHRAMRWLWLWLWVLIRCGQQVMPVDELRENQARAQVYLTALADYYTVHTQFPPNLTAIDVQLSGPLMTTLGTPFSYSRSETVGYFIVDPISCTPNASV